jgi:hypothetical protein
LCLEALEDRLVPSGNLLATVAGPFPTHLVQEYTSTGALVRSVNLPPTPGNNFDYARDLVEDPNGTIYVYNGTFTPYLEAYNPATGHWTQTTYPGWSTISDISSGGLAEFHNYLYASDMAIIGNTGGVVRINLTDGSSTHIGNVDFNDVTIGQDGLLYGLSEATATIYVYDPLSTALLRTVTLPTADYRGMAVSAAGDIFTVTWENVVSRFNASGTLENSITLNTTTGAPFMYNFSDNMDIAPDGTLAIGSFTGYIAQMSSAFTNISYIDTGTFDQVFVTFATEQTGPPPTTISVSDTSVQECPRQLHTKPARFTVTLSAPSSQQVVVNYVTANGTALGNGVDYQSVSGTLVFAPGTTTKVVTVPIVKDTHPDGSETFSLDLSAPVNAILGRAQATGTIVIHGHHRGA